MKFKKILIITFALVLCFSSAVCAFAVEAETVTEGITEQYSEADVIYEEFNNDITETENISEEEIQTETTTAPELEIFEATTFIETRTTLYFKDISISAHVKIKNKATNKEVEFDINSKNEWSFSAELDPGVYEIVSITPTSTQHKIKTVNDESGNTITEFTVKNVTGLQVINLYGEQKATLGLLAFLKKNIFLDVCAILLIVLYIINAKGYRIPILSNWLDNYRD